MLRIYGCLALVLSASTAVAAVGSNFLDLNLIQSHYGGGAEPGSQFNDYTVLSANLNLEAQSSGFTYKVNPLVQGVVQAEDEFYFAVPEAYVQPRKIAPGFNLTVGRQKRRWSYLDEEFQLGVWQPQVRWDYLAPKQQGLLGVFFDWSLSPYVRFTFLTSPFFLPDQGPNFRLRDGRFTSANRWFVAPHSGVRMFNNTQFASDAPLYFELDRPSEEEVIMNSTVGFGIQVQGSGPYWTQINYAYKPRNQIHLGIECVQCVKIPQTEVRALIHTKVVKHHVLTWESGFDRVDDRAWLSVTGDLPQQSGFPETYAESELNTMIIAGGAYQHYLGKWVKPSWMQYSYMRTHVFRRSNGNSLVASNDVQSSGDRYHLSEVVAVDWRIQLHSQARDRLNWRNRYMYSVPEKGGVLTSNLDWTVNDVTWTLGFDVLGADVAPDSKNAGMVSKYRANDRVYGGVSYVF